jgi:hypothetical protein
MHEGSEELPEPTGIDEIEIEFTVIDGGILCHRQPAPMEASIADAHLVN